MAQYFYLVSSLPSLAYGESPSLSCDSFEALCREHLNRADYELVRSSRLTGFDNATTHNSVLDAWYRWEINLRNELVKVRAQKQNRDAVRYMHPVSYVFGPEFIAMEAFSQPQPLAAEEVLDQARWQFLSNLESGHYFDVEKLIIYVLKLQLLEKKSERTVSRGKDFFDHMIATKLTEMKAGE